MAVATFRRFRAVSAAKKIATPIDFIGLRAGLSRRRSRVRVPSLPPFQSMTYCAPVIPIATFWPPAPARPRTATPPATMRSVSALASHPTIGSIVKPCASRIALGAAVMAGGEQFDASTNRRGRRATYPRYVANGPHCQAMWIGLAESRSAGGTEQTAGMLSGHLVGPGGNTTPEDIGSMGGEYGPLRRRHSGKGRAVPGRCPSIPVVPSFAALNPFYGADR